MSMTVVGGIVFSVFLMILLFVRGENIKRELKRANSKLESASRQKTHLGGIVMELAKEEQLMLKERMARIQTANTPNERFVVCTRLLIDASDSVISDAALGNRTVKKAFEYYISHFSDIPFTEFKAVILQEKKRQQLWAGDNIHAYLELCKSCISAIE
ncbi:hypothetical protein [Pseudoalteromonas aurantia]|uniref:DUF4760 domain-containing protein n=1 Tax=Pseudoalteromonas aurantia TaxID=43654 RepID=A0A5S3UYF2_9GAMM|nr:hypothetical protein [Pseudoalteromonas aurantia]TMO62101.1 hypothetical protein CWC19_20520 [Pseudoalteromonas aurantia]TMO63731.1 hypothetical protein CWC18_08220 [Pseudoalteromonas aurantia]TMO71604.1 hypothetical protein CWC20_17200 [Pseudoalteromonas aurantia]